MAVLCGCSGIAFAAAPPAPAQPPAPAKTAPAAKAPSGRRTPSSARTASGAKPAPASPATKAKAAFQGTYTFDAASSEIDYKAHSGSFKQITISEGKITVRADRAHATGLGQPSGQWTLTGNVRIHAPPHGNLTSDQAVVDILNNHITQATVTGNPAQFTQLGIAPGKVAEGHADQILYDIATGTVQLRKHAWLSDGRNQFSAPQLVYNILKDRIEATSRGPGERVHITITPRRTPGTGKKSATPPAAPRPPGRSS